MLIPWWHLPDAPLRSSLARTLAVWTGAAVLAAVAVETRLDSSLTSVAVTLGVFGAILLVVAGGLDAHHPFDRLGSANQVTLGRSLLVSLVGGLAVEPVSTAGAWLAVWLTALVAALDGVDGWLARRTGMASAFGARFDMEVDAFLILILSVLVWRGGKAGAWVLLCGLMRYLFVAAGRALPWMAGPLAPTRRGRTVAVSQLAGLGLALAPPIAPPFSTAVAAATLTALAWSFALDVGRLRRTGR